jgi:hypothetical protein
MDEPEHIKAAKWMLKTRLSHIQSLVDGKSLAATVYSLLRLIKDMEGAANETFLLEAPTNHNAKAD